MRCAWARLLVALAALMLLPGSSWGGVLYRCQMSGRVQATCCCAGRHELAKPAALPSARASDCCERLVPADGAKAIGTPSADDSIQPAALAAVVPVPLSVGSSPNAPLSTARQSRGPPGPRRPLFVVHCALLR